jgi:hypothetical protein
LIINKIKNKNLPNGNLPLGKLPFGKFFTAHKIKIFTFTKVQNIFDLQIK